jgi:hypothetical protein
MLIVRPNDHRGTLDINTFPPHFAVVHVCGWIQQLQVLPGSDVVVPLCLRGSVSLLSSIATCLIHGASFARVCAGLRLL